jgi:deazaflavin-dependent oxidoreductase (nitroreductase family)
VTLNYFKEDFEFVVIASNAGDDSDPLWWRNLKENREAQVRVGTRRFTARAREADGAQRARLWAALIARDPSYAEYERTTTRRIPVVLLEPVTD